MQKRFSNKQWCGYISNRTFGMELEFADGDKELIVLPEGYKWTDNEMTMMNNSDGSAVSHKSRYGGEINTRPYHYTESDLGELESFINQMKNAGSYLMWNEGFDAHFYIKDMSLDVIKRLFALSYYTAFPIKRIFDVPEWWETKYLVPSPTWEVTERVLASEDLGHLLSVFANGSDRGHIRYWLNLCSISKIGTCEFRNFNSSWDFAKIRETIEFMYSFVEYAYLHEDIEEYKHLNTVEACIEAFKINFELIPTRHKPLLWAAEHSDNVTTVGQQFRKTSRMLSYIRKVSARFDTAHIVNSFYFDIEQILDNREIKVYTKEYMIYLYDLIVKGVVKELKFSNDYSFLDDSSGEPDSLLATMFLFDAIKKHNNSDDIYHKSLYDDFLTRLDEYHAKYKAKYKRVVDNLRGKNIEVVYHGSLEDAVMNCTSEDILIYQNEFNSKVKATSNALKRCLLQDYGWQDRQPTPYAAIDEEQVNYISISQHGYMGRRKVLADGRMFLYSNIGDPGDNNFNKRTIEPLKYRRLPDDYKITENSKLKFMRAKMSEIYYLRMIYLKKGIIMGSAPFCYLWFLDDYVFGACMFDFIKVNKYGFDAVYMKSDFVIDHPIKKLSKLLILAVLSTEFKDELKIQYKHDIGVISTAVFTDKPVSMKYRGVFKLDERATGKLYYTQQSGVRGRLKEIIKQFVKNGEKEIQD